MSDHAIATKQVGLWLKLDDFAVIAEAAKLDNRTVSGWIKARAIRDARAELRKAPTEEQRP